MVSLESIRVDVERFSKLHSWYKHLPLTGNEFVVIFDKGEQPRHSICPEIKDKEGMHAIILDLSWLKQHYPDCKYTYTFKFNCFLRGLEKYGGYRQLCGINHDEYIKFIKDHGYDRYNTEEIFEKEHQRQVDHAVQMIYQEALEQNFIINDDK